MHVQRSRKNIIPNFTTNFKIKYPAGRFFDKLDSKFYNRKISVRIFQQIEIAVSPFLKYIATCHKRRFQIAVFVGRAVNMHMPTAPRTCSRTCIHGDLRSELSKRAWAFEIARLHVSTRGAMHACPRMCVHAREAVRTCINMRARVCICEHVQRHAHSSTRMSAHMSPRTRSIPHAFEHAHTHVDMCARAQHALRHTTGALRMDLCACPLSFLVINRWIFFPISISIK